MRGLSQQNLLVWCYLSMRIDICWGLDTGPILQMIRMGLLSIRSLYTLDLENRGASCSAPQHLWRWLAQLRAAFYQSPYEQSREGEGDRFVII